MKKANEENKEKQKRSFKDIRWEAGQFISRHALGIFWAALGLSLFTFLIYLQYQDIRQQDEDMRLNYKYAVRYFESYYLWNRDEESEQYKQNMEEINRKTESFVPYYRESVKVCMKEVEEQGVMGLLKLDEKKQEQFEEALEKYYNNEWHQSEWEYDRKILYGGCSILEETDLDRFFDGCWNINQALHNYRDMDMRISVMIATNERAREIEEELGEKRYE